jgi:hypothetical protein
MEITFATLDAHVRVAIMASANTNVTDHSDPALWAAALDLETLAHGRLTDRQKDAIWNMDRLMTAFAGMVSTGDGPRYRARSAARFLAAIY